MRPPNTMTKETKIFEQFHKDSIALSQALSRIVKNGKTTGNIKNFETRLGDILGSLKVLFENSEIPDEANLMEIAEKRYQKVKKQINNEK